MKILITGGASGLGEAISRKLTKEKHEVYITYFKSNERAENLRKEINLKGTINVDFGSKESLVNLQEYIYEIKPDVLVNNALACLSQIHFHKMDINKIEESFRINIIPTLLITQSMIKVFRAKKFGKIINIISSYVVNTPPIGLSEYTANKAFLLSMSKSWASENIKYNITSNCISPSFLKTPLNSDVDSRIIENMTKAHPLKKLLSLDEVAQSVSFLTSSTQQINGVNLILNAGQAIV